MSKFKFSLTPHDVRNLVFILFVAFLLGSSTFLYFSSHDNNEPETVVVEQ